MYNYSNIMPIVVTTLFFLLTFFVTSKSKSYKDASTFMIVLFFLHCFFIAVVFTLEQTTFRLTHTIYALLNLITLIVMKKTFVKRNQMSIN